MEPVSPTAEMLRREQRLAANRERVRRYRMKHNPPRLVPEPSKTPMSNTKRAQNFRVRKRLQTKAIQAPIFEPPARREPKQFPSKERMRAYHQRHNNQPEQRKRTPFSNRERAKRFYAKKQQIRLKSAIQMRETDQMSPMGSNIEEV